MMPWWKRDKKEVERKFLGYRMEEPEHSKLLRLYCGRDSCPFNFATANRELAMKLALIIHPRCCRGRDKEKSATNGQ